MECGFESQSWHLCRWARYFNCFSSTRRYKWVAVRVEVDIVFEECYWPNDQCTKVLKVHWYVAVTCAVRTCCYYFLLFCNVVRSCLECLTYSPYHFCDRAKNWQQINIQRRVTQSAFLDSLEVEHPLPDFFSIDLWCRWFLCRKLILQVTSSSTVPRRPRRKLINHTTDTEMSVRVSNNKVIPLLTPWYSKSSSRPISKIWYRHCL